MGRSPQCPYCLKPLAAEATRCAACGFRLGDGGDRKTWLIFQYINWISVFGALGFGFWAYMSEQSPKPDWRSGVVAASFAIGFGLFRFRRKPAAERILSWVGVTFGIELFIDLAVVSSHVHVPDPWTWVDHHVPFVFPVAAVAFIGLAIYGLIKQRRQ